MKNMKTKSHKTPELSLRETLAMMREMRATEKQSFQRVNERVTTVFSLLKEDFSGSNNQEYQEDQQAMVSALNATVVITSREDNGQKVTLSGTIKFNSEVKFIFTTERNDGIYISTDSLQMDEEVLQSLMKMRAYYEQWYQTNIQRVNGGEESSAITPQA
jgi:hypothetical protein